MQTASLPIFPSPRIYLPRKPFPRSTPPAAAHALLPQLISLNPHISRPHCTIVAPTTRPGSQPHCLYPITSIHLRQYSPPPVAPCPIVAPIPRTEPHSFLDLSAHSPTHSQLKPIRRAAARPHQPPSSAHQPTPQRPTSQPPNALLLNTANAPKPPPRHPNPSDTLTA